MYLGFIVFLVLAVPAGGWPTALISAYVIAMCGINKIIFSMPGNGVIHYGIAPSAPTIYLSDILLLAALLAIWAAGGRLRIGWLLAAFALPCLVMVLTVWGNTTEQWSGLELYVTALISFGLGRWLSENMTEKGANVLVSACLISCGLQFIASVAQSRGSMFRVSEAAQGWVQDGRMVGLFNHPGELGKAMFLSFCFLLPLSTSANVTTRRLAYVALGLGSVATLLTLSRANSAAIALAVVIWAIVNRRRNTISTRVGILAGAALVAILNLDTISGLQLRQEVDPEGGYRQQILAVGLEQIQSAFWTGTGPNYYTEVVGQYNHLAANGFPLHNSLLYPIAEMGLILGLLLLAPVVITLGHAVMRYLNERAIDVQTAALMAVLPGVVIIAWTGWGMIAKVSLPLWFLAFGFLASRHGISGLGVHEDRADAAATGRSSASYA